MALDPFPLKSWVRFTADYEIFVAGVVIHAGTIAEVTQVDATGMWVRPIKRIANLDEWLNEVQLWDWREENDNPSDDWAGLYLALTDSPF